MPTTLLDWSVLDTGTIGFVSSLQAGCSIHSLVPETASSPPLVFLVTQEDVGLRARNPARRVGGKADSISHKKLEARAESNHLVIDCLLMESINLLP